MARKKKTKGKPPNKKPAPPPQTVTEKLKEKSTQSGDQAMAATPDTRPAEPADADAVYTTGPGQVVAYDYQRQGTYAEDYAQQQSQVSVQGNPIAGPGQTVTSGAVNGQ